MEGRIKLSYDKTVTGTETINNYVGATTNTNRVVLESDTDKIVYVNKTTGSDVTGDGSSGNPYASLTTAYGDISPPTKTTVEVQDSETYNENVSQPTQAAKGQKPVFSSTGGKTITGNLLGFYITGGTQNIQANIYNCDIYGVSSFTFSIACEEFQRNAVYDCTDLPAFVPGAAGSLDCTENLFINNPNQILNIDGSGTGVIFDKNTFFGNSYINFDNNAGTEVFKYNILSGNTNTEVVTADVAITAIYCCINPYGGLNGLGAGIQKGTGTILADPLFKSTASPVDFNLQSIASDYIIDSPAIGLSDETIDTGIYRDAGCYNIKHVVSYSWTDYTLIAPMAIDVPINISDYIERFMKSGAFKSSGSLIQLEINLLWEHLKTADTEVLRQILISGGDIKFYPNPSGDPTYYLDCKVRRNNLRSFSMDIANGTAYMKPVLSLITQITRAQLDLKDGVLF